MAAFYNPSVEFIDSGEMIARMLQRCVCVSFYRGHYINVDDQEKIFAKYGKVSQIIASKFFKDHFFVVFETLQSAVKCFRSRMYLLKTFGYIIDLDGENWHEENALEPYGGKVDYHSPSLMDLNEDCLLHLMSYLRKDSAVKFVCARLRRLWNMSWSRVRRLHVNKDYLGLDRIYLSGHLATQLTVYERAMHRIHTESTYQLIFERCEKLQRLDFSNTVLSSGTLGAMKKFLPAVTEIIFKFVRADGLSMYLQSSKLEKLFIYPFRLYYLYYQSILQNEFMRNIVNTLSLTTLIFPTSPVNVSQILALMPHLRVLVCTLDSFRFPDTLSITNHSLIELSVRFRGGEGSFDRLINIREFCPNLRHLGIFGLNVFDHDLRQLLPLEGLRVEPGYRKMDINLNGLSVLADHLKVFFLDYKYSLQKDYPMILSQFTKLEVISWFYGNRCDFEKFMEDRLAQTSLKVFVTPKWKPTMVDPKCQYLTDRTEFFGPFSIYRDWGNFNLL